MSRRPEKGALLLMSRLPEVEVGGRLMGSPSIIIDHQWIASYGVMIRDG